MIESLRRTATGSARVGATVLVLLVLAACSGNGGGEDMEISYYGLYSVDDESVQRLDGDAAWERATWPQRSDFDPGVEFIVFDPVLGQSAAPLAQTVRLVRVAQVRNEIQPTGEVVPVSDAWYPPDLEGYEILVDYSPVQNRDDAVRVTPRSELAPGLYSLQLITPQGSRTARVGVAWSSVDKAAYAEANCVNRYLGETATYRACGDEPPGGGLSVHLVAPQRDTSNGQNTLVVEGVVVNVSDRTIAVPRLIGTLENGDDVVVHRWTFETTEARLAPGASTSFRTEVVDPPPDELRVNVDFAPQTAADAS